MRFSSILLIFLATLGMAQTPAPPQAYPDWAKVEKDVPYTQFKETVLDIAQPAEATGAKRPGAIIVHGGGWTGA